MKVLYFHQHFSTPAGATGVRSYHMASALITAGHEVTMVCGSYGVGSTGLSGPFKNKLRSGTVDGIEVIEFDLAYSNTDSFLTRSLSFMFYAWKSTRLALAEDYDVVFATSTPLTAGIPGIAARWVRRKPFVFEVRDLWPELPREMGVITNPFVLFALSCLEWASYRSASRCIGLSPGIVEGIKRRVARADLVHMIPNGCDLETFGPDVERAWRPEGVEPDDLLAVFTGTHGIANGLDSVLNAAAVLKGRENSRIKIVMIGHGKLKPALMARAELEGLDNCIFIDSVPKQRLAGLLAGADVGLMILANVPAFYHGTSPNKFFDYLASGLPVINNYPGWLASMIESNHCGYVVMPDDAQAFADALEAAEANREALVAMGGNARALGARDFDWKSLTGQFCAAITRSAVGAKSTRQEAF